MPLFDYQSAYLEGLPKDVIMSAATGTGKGQLSLAHYKRHNPNQPLLVVAPASKVREGGWLREFELASLPPTPVISYDRFSRYWHQYLSEDITVIFDEAHYIANASSKRSKAAIKFCQVARQFILLTATPLPNGWRSGETYAILTGLARNKTDFVQRFEMIDRSRGFPLLLGYRNEDTLSRWWHSVSRPLERTGALKLPSKSVPVTPTPTPKTLQRTKRAITQRLDDESEPLDNPSALFTYLRQVPVTERMDALHNVLDGTDESVVVFYNFNTEREAIHTLLAKHFPERPVYEQSGHASYLPPRAEWDTLPPSVTLVQYQSGAQGIELTYASITVFLSPPTSWALYEQSRGRNLRHGQTKSVLFYHVSASDLDKRLWGLVKSKGDFNKRIQQEWYDEFYKKG